MGVRKYIDSGLVHSVRFYSLRARPRAGYGIQLHSEFGLNGYLRASVRVPGGSSGVRTTLHVL
eukprot:1612944-Prymnesium_polylepis.1